MTGPNTYVFATAEWEAEQRDLEPKTELEQAVKVIVRLGHTDLETMKKTAGVGALKGRSGLFEVRKGGVRFYGARLAVIGGKEICVLLGAEHKKGRADADDGLLDRCEARQRTWAPIVGKAVTALEKEDEGTNAKPR